MIVELFTGSLHMPDGWYRTPWSWARSRRTLAAAAVLVSCGLLSACDGAPDLAAGEPGSGGDSAEQTVPPVRLTTNLGKDTGEVPVDRMVELGVTGGTLQSVKVTSELGALSGKASPNRQSWTATDRLEPGVDYTVRASLRRSDGKVVTRRSTFHTEDLTLDEQTYPSVAPLAGETVGVGMPVIVTFDIPVTDRATIERHMSVTSTPRQQGSWHWISDQEVHWRPKTYWQAGSEVTVDVDINSIPAGAGIYGQESRRVEFTVGDANVYKVNARTYQMQVFSNGTLLRTIPITTGEQPEFTTRSGIKVIMEKFESRRMNSETIGIPQGTPGAYDLDNVQWAMRLTYSGEFMHAAPWSVGSQGNANVSHGCTGMSTANAAWLYAMSKRGDVVEYTGTDRYMTLTNGYGDWNASFAEYAQGSALN